MENTASKNSGFTSSDFSVLKRLLRYAKPYKKQFIISSAIAVFLSVLGPLRPYLIQITIDDYIMPKDMHGLMIISLISLVVLIAENVAKYYFIFLTNWLGQTIVKNLRVNVFSHIIQLRLSYFDKTPVGTSTTRTINDLETINSVFTEGIIQIIADLLTIIFVVAFMFYINWQLALICMISFPLMIYATYIFKEGIKITFQAVRTQVALQNAFLQERITGMKIVQIFNAEQREFDKFKIINEAHKKANVKSVWYYSIFFPVVEIIMAIALASMVWYGAHSVLQGFTTIGQITGFILYLNMLFRPMRVIADKFNTLQMGFVAGERIFRILDNDEIIANNGKMGTELMQGKIEFDKVWFAYRDENWVLKNIEFQINVGETLAIVGATGAGKSSVVQILNRLYEIQKGHILIDDISIEDYDLYALRQKIGMVQQDVFLFSGSIIDNITLNNKNIKKETVIEAARMLGAHDFIMQLPGDYNYNVMERGATLSLGQRQIISFIRAFVFNPKILILDEATSSIDLETESIIQNAIDHLITNRTSIVIAHRLSTIRKANQIIVLDKGEIIEKGTHDFLLELNGVYKKLYDIQFTKEEKN